VTTTRQIALQTALRVYLESTTLEPGDIVKLAESFYQFLAADEREAEVPIRLTNLQYQTSASLKPQL
jgi:hypothetical protein